MWGQVVGTSKPNHVQDDFPLQPVIGSMLGRGVRDSFAERMVEHVAVCVFVCGGGENVMGVCVFVCACVYMYFLKCVHALTTCQ